MCLRYHGQPTTKDVTYVRVFLLKRPQYHLFTNKQSGFSQDLNTISEYFATHFDFNESSQALN